jgi:hypothetical protein
MYKNLLVSKRVLVDVSLQLLTVPGKVRDWFVGGITMGGRMRFLRSTAISKAGWMEGAVSSKRAGSFSEVKSWTLFRRNGPKDGWFEM